MAWPVQHLPFMKTLYLPQVLLCAAIFTAFSLAAGGVSFADDHHDAWSHDKDGYWDNHGARHAYIMHENHHGFWRDRDDGTRIFINID
jgi:hypothetical protein